MDRKRFRVLDYQRCIVYKSDYTQDCYEYIKNSHNDLISYIYDIEDDITIDVDEFTQAFEEGECPGDLQFF